MFGCLLGIILAPFWHSFWRPILEAYFGPNDKETRLKVKDQQPHLVKIKSMKKEKPTISKVKYEETPF